MSDLPDRDPAPPPRTTPLDALHRRLGGRMIDFAGWSLPVQFAGTLAEHAHTRTHASLFDVSHMGQVSLHGQDAAAALEKLTPSDIVGLAPGRQRYALLTNELGGIIDDIMVAKSENRLFVVLNASRSEGDISHLRIHGIEPELHEDRALLALQGPLAVAIMARLAPPAASLPFLGVTSCTVAGIACWVSRSGYTGEDGFEISVPAQDAEALATRLLAEPECAPAGLAARDTLAAGGRPLPLRPGHRHADQPDRGGPRLDHPEAAPRGARLPGCRHHRRPPGR